MPGNGSKRAHRAECWQRRASTGDAPVALDLDGVSGSATSRSRARQRAVRRLRAAGEPVVFVTNNSDAAGRRPGGQAGPARASTPRGDVVTSAMAAARAARTRRAGARRRRRRRVEAARGSAPPARRRGAATGPADAVVVGFHRDFDYDRLRHRGRRRSAAAPGSSPPTTTPPIRRQPGRSPAAGRSSPPSSAPSGAAATVAGKPHPPMADLVRARLGPTGTWSATDPTPTGGFAAGPRLPLRPRAQRGRPTPTDAVGPEPDVVAADLAALVDRLATLLTLASSHRRARSVTGCRRTTCSSATSTPASSFTALTQCAGRGDRQATGQGRRGAGRAGAGGGRRPPGPQPGEHRGLLATVRTRCGPRSPAWGWPARPTSTASRSGSAGWSRASRRRRTRPSSWPSRPRHRPRTRWPRRRSPRPRRPGRPPARPRRRRRGPPRRPPRRPPGQEDGGQEGGAGQEDGGQEGGAGQEGGGQEGLIPGSAATRRRAGPPRARPSRRAGPGRTSTPGS